MVLGCRLAIREPRLGADHPDPVRSQQNPAALVAQLERGLVTC
jgi:hypothetical protein